VLPDPRTACAEIGTACSSERALQRMGRGKDAALVVIIPG